MHHHVRRIEWSRRSVVFGPLEPEALDCRLTSLYQMELTPQISEVSTVGSIIPGSVVSALITNVLPNGLNVRVCGFFDGTVELAHLAIGDQDVEDAFKVGKRVSGHLLCNTY